MLSLSTNAIAEIKVYQSTDNTGLNKQERIEAVEGYLVDISKSLKTMESKLDENTKKMGILDSLIKSMGAQKAADEKLILEKASEKKEEPKAAEAVVIDLGVLKDIEKLKIDVLALKNDDIEKLKINFQELNDTVKAIQATIKSQLEAAGKNVSKKASTAK